MTKLTQEELQERADLLDQAIELIEEAMEKADLALSGTPLQSHYDAYGRYGIDQALGNGNPYDTSLDKVKKKLFDEETWS